MVGLKLDLNLFLEDWWDPTQIMLKLKKYLVTDSSNTTIFQFSGIRKFKKTGCFAPKGMDFTKIYQRVVYLYCNTKKLNIYKLGQTIKDVRCD